MTPQEARKKANHFARLQNIKPTKKPRACDCVYCTSGPRRPNDLLVNAPLMLNVIIAERTFPGLI